jgi:hypothetical protein
LSFEDQHASDAALDGDTSGPIHHYRLVGSFADELGGPALVPLGGMLGTNGYAFTPNHGLVVTNAMPMQVYTVQISFELDSFDSWRKILDYSELVDDNGFYTYNADLQFVAHGQDAEFSTSLDFFAPNTPALVALTRDALGHMIGYVNGVRAIEFDDQISSGAFAGPDANFFVDDSATNIEATNGVVFEITIWNRVLSAAELVSG